MRNGFALTWAGLLLALAVSLVTGLAAVGTLYAGTPPISGNIVMGQMDAEAFKTFRFGDVIQSIAGEPVRDSAAAREIYARIGVGKVVDHVILRGQQTVIVASRVRPFGWNEYWQTAGSSLILAVGFLAMGLFMARVGRSHAEARTLSIWCGVFSFTLANNGNFSLVHATFPLEVVGAALVGGLLLRLTTQMGPRRESSWVPIFGSLILAGIVLAVYPWGQASDYSTLHRLTGFYGFLAVVMAWPSVIGAIVFPLMAALNMRQVERLSLAFQQNRILLWSSILAFSPPSVAWSTMLAGLGTPIWMAHASLLSFLLMPAGMLFAVLRFRLFELELLIRRTIVYSALATMLAILYMSTVGVFVRTFGTQHGEGFRLMLFMIMALAFDPIRRRLQESLDRTFDRGRIDLLDVQRKISLRAAEHRDTTQTLEGVTRDLQDALKLTVCALGLVHEDQVWLTAGEPELLGTCLPVNRLPAAAHWDRNSHGDFPWPTGIEAAYVITLRDRLLAVIFLGPKLSQEPLNSQDFDYLGLISGQIGLLLSYTQVLDRQAAVDREMQTLMRKVSELNDLRSSFGIVAGHELRTPLTVIRGHAEALLSGVFGDLDPEQEESVHSIFRSATSMTLQITSYLDLMALREKRLVLRPAHCDLGTILFELLESWTEELEAKNLQLRVDLGQAEKVYADARRIRQVVEQLLSNAVKFTPAGGSIVLSADTDALHVVLRIQDSGPGIAAEALERAFDDFAQVADPTRRDHGGLGLGLPLAKALLEAMQGWIDYTRSADGGSIFLCAMPLPAEVREQRRLRSGLFPTQSTQRLKTLEDPQTGLWRVFPEDDTPPQRNAGVTLENVRYEKAGNPADWQHPDDDE